MYIVGVGAGAIGTPLVDIAPEAGHEVVVVERDDTKADAVAGNYDCLVTMTAQSNVGLDTGITGPVMPDITKPIQILDV